MEEISLGTPYCLILLFDEEFEIRQQFDSELTPVTDIWECVKMRVSNYKVNLNGNCL